jgi:Tol biopolymer transport system component
MTGNNDVLERLAPLSGAPSRGYEDLLRLRAKRQRIRKIGVLAFVTALLVVLVSVGLAIEDGSEKTANPPDTSHAVNFTGMVIRYTGDFFHDTPSGDLVAEDPRTGEVITLAATSDFRDNTISWAAASADGRWVAFRISFCDDDPTVADWERRSGLWVTNGTDEPRQLTAPCVEGSEPSDFSWSPTKSQLATVLGDHLVLIDPATGDRTDLGKTEGLAGPPVWSPDGNRIAYGAVPFGSPNGNSPDGSVYLVSVDGGEHALIAESIGQVPGGEEGSGIAWSPDGTRIAVLADGNFDDPMPQGELYFMHPDGSGRRLIAENLVFDSPDGSPSIAWSPDGTRIAYATFSPVHHGVRFWSVQADGSTPILVFDPTSSQPEDTEFGGPIWSPDGTRIAFRYDSRSLHRSYLIANADGTGDVHEINELRYRGWRGGWYFCECYG